MAKIIPISEHFQHFLTELKEGAEESSRSGSRNRARSSRCDNPTIARLVPDPWGRHRREARRLKSGGLRSIARISFVSAVCTPEKLSLSGVARATLFGSPSFAALLHHGAHRDKPYRSTTRVLRGCLLCRRRMPNPLRNHPADRQRIRLVGLYAPETPCADDVPGFERIADTNVQTRLRAAGAEKEMVRAGRLDADRGIPFEEDAKDLHAVWRHCIFVVPRSGETSP
jgi:hypothetical protein